MMMRMLQSKKEKVPWLIPMKLGAGRPSCSGSSLATAFHLQALVQTPRKKIINYNETVIRSEQKREKSGDNSAHRVHNSREMDLCLENPTSNGCRLKKLNSAQLVQNDGAVLFNDSKAKITGQCYDNETQLLLFKVFNQKPAQNPSRIQLHRRLKQSAK